MMVCMDGFILTHATERVDLPDPEARRRLPARPTNHARCSTPTIPYSIGAMVGPEAFEEVRYLAHVRQLTALDRIRELGAEFAEAFGRDSGGLVHPYRSADADIVVVAHRLGARDDQGRRGHPAGRRGADRRPRDHLVPALPDRRRAARRCGSATRSSWSRRPSASASAACSRPTWPWRSAALPVAVATVVAGLGGRPITKASLEGVFEAALRDELERLTFLDLNTGLVERELARMARGAAPGPPPRTCSATWASSDRGSADMAVRFYQVGQLRSRATGW